MPVPCPALPAPFLRLPIAHRGLHDAAVGTPENSLGAVRAAAAAGYGIEIDVQLSADGRAIVFHDETLDRLTGQTGALAARTAAELGQIGLIGSDACIPTLAQVLAEVAGRVALLIEIKDQSGRGLGSDGRLEAAVAADLAGYDGPVALMSFNPDQMAQAARLAPAIPRGLTSCDFSADDWPDLNAAERERLRAIADFGPVGASFVSHAWRDLGRARVGELAAAGAAILCWTIRSPAAEAEARRIARNITFEGYAAAIPA
jgi:glycerophosphoryl diester phosphodiesterase